jgi:hypothetical protein
VLVAAPFVRAIIPTLSNARCMDWATNDYTQVYADTYVVPPDDSGSGVYLDDPVDHGNSLKEGFYRGLQSSRRRHAPPRAVAWDVRPDDTSRLIPPLSQRPNRGSQFVPRYSPVAPIIPPSPYTRARIESFDGAPACACAPACAHMSTEIRLQYVQFMLIVVVVLLAMTLIAVGKIATSLEGLLQTAVGVLHSRPAQ